MSNCPRGGGKGPVIPISFRCSEMGWEMETVEWGPKIYQAFVDPWVDCIIVFSPIAQDELNCGSFTP